MVGSAMGGPAGQGRGRFTLEIPGLSSAENVRSRYRSA